MKYQGCRSSYLKVVDNFKVYIFFFKNMSKFKVNIMPFGMFE